MLPSSTSQSSSRGRLSYHLTTPPPGHQRNRIACSRCRKKKVKCTGGPKDNPTGPCQRCVADRRECEYVPLSNNESGGGELSWTPNLDPESYAQSHGAFPTTSHSSNPAYVQPHTGYGSQSFGLPSEANSGHRRSSQLIPAGPSSTSQYGMPAADGTTPGNLMPSGSHFGSYPSANQAAMPYYGSSYYAQPADSTYYSAWPQSSQPIYGECACSTRQCMCGLRKN
ncbi:Zn(2)-C6 fungal-type domain-containing protein [Favolaschia claudopus]|uniref:Zn(2)-C6 fungal-type domain-containing protein n=1 Tax=Favolaschia claudopus TaxID=2862362 RepID=A0AAW0DRI4_9AGAR